MDDFRLLDEWRQLEERTAAKLRAIAEELQAIKTQVVAIRAELERARPRDEVS